MRVKEQSNSCQVAFPYSSSFLKLRSTTSIPRASRMGFSIEAQVFSGSIMVPSGAVKHVHVLREDGITHQAYLAELAYCVYLQMAQGT